VALRITSGIPVTAAVTFSSRIDLWGSGPDRMRQQKGWTGGVWLPPEIAAGLTEGWVLAAWLVPVYVPVAASVVVEEETPVFWLAVVVVPDEGRAEPEAMPVPEAEAGKRSVRDVALPNLESGPQ